MSLVSRKERKKKGKYPRDRISRKILHRQRIKKKILNNRRWKLDYPDTFELIDTYPYIIRKQKK